MSSAIDAEMMSKCRLVEEEREKKRNKVREARGFILGLRLGWGSGMQACILAQLSIMRVGGAVDRGLAAICDSHPLSASIYVNSDSHTRFVCSL